MKFVKILSRQTVMLLQILNNFALLAEKKAAKQSFHESIEEQVLCRSNMKLTKGKRRPQDN